MVKTGQIQFNLPAVFWLTTLVASSLVAFGPGGLFLAIVAGVFWAYVYGGDDRPKRLLRACGWLFTMLLFITLLLPPLRYAHEAAQHTQCANNLKSILLALLNYESANGHFPPSYVTDENGRPMHSWRVLILPYLEESRGIYAKYRLDQPWDSPHNRKLIAQIPYVYQCPTHFGSEHGNCNYAAILGPDTAWREGQGIKLSEIMPNTSTTLWICETLHGFPWTKPEDVTPEEFVSKARSILLMHDSGGHLLEDSFVTNGCRINLGFVDGHVESIDVPRDPTVLRRLASRMDDYRHHNNFDALFRRRVKWGKIIAVSSFVVLCLLPVVRLRHTWKNPAGATLPPTSST